MTFTKKHAWLLIAVAIWNFIIWGRFIKALTDAHAAHEVHPHGYYIAHSILIVINFVIGAVLLALGVKALRAAE